MKAPLLNGETILNAPFDVYCVCVYLWKGEGGHAGGAQQEKEQEQAQAHKDGQEPGFLTLR